MKIAINIQSRFPVIIGFFFLIFWGLGCKSVETQPESPNFIILFADDLGYGDLSTFGHPTIRTPHLDRMARQGIKFTQFYSASPACTASRYSLLTGKYPRRSGFDWVLYPNSPRGVHPEERLISEYLKDLGYSTACFGKWHLGTTKVEFHPLQNGFDEYYGLPYSNDMLPPRWGEMPLIHNYDTIELSPDQSKLTATYTEKAIEFIRQNQKTPFFIYLPYAMPHIPLHAGTGFNDSKRGLYGDVVEEIDWSTGQILAALDELNISKKTLVIFTSDNGPWIIKGTSGGSSGLLRDGKGSTWEGGMRVPAIAKWPGVIPAGISTPAITGTIDLLPTFLGFAGYENPQITSDGHDIRKILQETAMIENDRIFYYYGQGNELYAIRKGMWKLHLKTYSQTGQQYFGEQVPLLFNLDEDPSEKHELSEEFPEVVNQLQILADSHTKELMERGTFFDQ